MTHLIKPERLGLVCCPNREAHENDERIAIPFRMEGMDPKYLVMYVIRLAIQINGVSHNYNYPPVDFVESKLDSYRIDFPSMPIYIGEKTCAVCNGFDKPELYRKKFRDNSEDYDIDFDP